VIERLSPPRGDEWTAYVDTHTYDDDGVRMKEGFVGESLAAVHPGVVVDLGTNVANLLVYEGDIHAALRDYTEQPK